ncbi:helix-turn-helix domain-containing protein [Weeksellaceae bacterium KMM 9713]|uniref:Helix-turn-helix domain-containing protein n=1 Tax=Profundicola chukchiensis TaxID=2961959 RepID=A0A9X4RWV7_9FLAO|nr:helix-turn-helix domain-containing protein [Profundicola chukchiensis]MDG4944984.1 helix-turn-helix domain-containing protein [Profundicola chukchiensis]
MDKAKTLQLISITPDQLADIVSQRVRIEFEKAKEEFSTAPKKEFLTRESAAEFLSISLPTLHNYTKQGKLKAYALGSRVYYLRNEIETMMEPLKYKHHE